MKTILTTFNLLLTIAWTVFFFYTVFAVLCTSGLIAAIIGGIVLHYISIGLSSLILSIELVITKLFGINIE